jgi:phage shock protein PspC (stress-responsive transcriptional regulator)
MSSTTVTTETKTKSSSGSGVFGKIIMLLIFNVLFMYMTVVVYFAMARYFSPEPPSDDSIWTGGGKVFGILLLCLLVYMVLMALYAWVTYSLIMPSTTKSKSTTTMTSS